METEINMCTNRCTGTDEHTVVYCELLMSVGTIGQCVVGEANAVCYAVDGVATCRVLF